ncbi:MAG: 1,4-dihydroxy-6-naphthoate synthase [Pseudomonadota bacterium]
MTDPDMMTLELGYSPCPNDTFMFYGFLGRDPAASGGLDFNTRLEDIETLNTLAIEARLDVTKISCAAFAHVAEHYCLLRSGAALGRGCGPLVVSHGKNLGLAALAENTLVALPGRLTTASLLFSLYGPAGHREIQMPFHEIMPAVASGRAEAGVIIHEGRFTYPSYGLHLVADLGLLWEEDTGLPLPLGAMAARRVLGQKTLLKVEAAIRASIGHARAHQAEAVAHAGRFAQEMSPEVLRAHINLYVNDLSLDLGPEGERAIRLLLARGRETGALPENSLALFPA